MLRNLLAAVCLTATLAAGLATARAMHTPAARHTPVLGSCDCDPSDPGCSP